MVIVVLRHFAPIRRGLAMGIASSTLVALLSRSPQVAPDGNVQAIYRRSSSIFISGDVFKRAAMIRNKALLARVMYYMHRWLRKAGVRFSHIESSSFWQAHRGTSLDNVSIKWKMGRYT